MRGTGRVQWDALGCQPQLMACPLFFPPPGLVRLHREHSHHRRAGDPAALQRHHQAGDSEETARGGAALPQGPQPARRLDRGVQNPLPRQNSSPDKTDPQAAPPVLLEPGDSPPSSNTPNARATAPSPRGAEVPQHFQMQKKKTTTLSHHFPSPKIPPSPLPHPSLSPPIPLPIHPSWPVFYSSSREAPAHQGSPSCRTCYFFFSQRPSFSSSHKRAAWALCLGRRITLWVFLSPAFQATVSHEKLDLSGSGAV